MKRVLASPAAVLLGVLFALAFADGLTAWIGEARPPFARLPMFAVTSFLWSAVLIVPALLLGRRSRWFYVPLVAYWVPMIALQCHSRFRYGMPLDGSWVGIALCGSVSEVGWYLKNHLSLVAVSVLLLVLAGTICTVRRFAKGAYPPFSRLGFLAALLFALAFAALRRDTLTQPRLLVSDIPSFAFLLDTYAQTRAYQTLLNICAHPRLPASVSLAVPASRAPVGVFVIGESATRSHWGLYGYARETTPRMSAIADRLCIFSNVTASASYTAAVMRDLLTKPRGRASRDAYNLPQVLNAAGYDCVMVTSDERWGQGNGLETFLFHGCRELHFLAEKELPEPWYDDAQLPFLEEALQADGSRPLVVFLHLRGSHTPMDSQYPSAFAPFPGEEIRRLADRSVPAKCLNHYDNSIAFTDALLGRVVELLERANRPAWMLYVSDHGESVASSSWRNVKDRNLWDVPMIWWHNVAYSELAPDTVRAMREASGAPLVSSDVFDLVVRSALVRIDESE